MITTPEQQPEEQEQQQESLFTLGQQVRAAREQLSLSREDVANTLGYAETTIYKIENGTIPVSKQFTGRWNKNFSLQLPGIPQEQEEEKSEIEQPAQPELRVVAQQQQELPKIAARAEVVTNTMQFLFSPTKGVRLDFFGKINDADIRLLIRLLNNIQERWPTFP